MKQKQYEYNAFIMRLLDLIYTIVVHEIRSAKVAQETMNNGRIIMN